MNLTKLSGIKCLVEKDKQTLRVLLVVNCIMSKFHPITHNTTVKDKNRRWKG